MVNIDRNIRATCISVFARDERDLYLFILVRDRGGSSLAGINASKRKIDGRIIHESCTVQSFVLDDVARVRSPRRHGYTCCRGIGCRTMERMKDLTFAECITNMLRNISILRNVSIY